MVEISTLRNGLRVVSDHVVSVETVSVGVWVGTGTRAETLDNNGVAHFLEHMAFKGTDRRSALDIAEEVEAVGAHMNAYTGRETTAYFMKLMKQDVPLALDILGDILLNPAFDLEEIERERSVIQQEIGQVEDTPDDVIFDRFQLAAFPGQSMGFSTLGTPDSVNRISDSDLRSFMASGYTAENMVLAAAGKIDHGDLVAMAERYFGELRSGAGPARRPAAYRGGEHRDSRASEQAHLLLGFEAMGLDSDAHYAGTLLSTVLGGGMSSRLFQEVREKRGLVYSIYAFNSPASDSGVFGVYAGTGPDEIDALLPVVCDELMRSTETIGQADLARAKAQLKSSTLMALESTAARLEQLGSQMLVMGRPVPVEEQIEKIEALGVEDLTQCAQRIFSGRPTVSAIGPLQRLAPLEEIAARFSGLRAVA